MRSVYNRNFKIVFATGGTDYVLSDRIDPGCILHVHSCFAYAPERDANDNIIIGLRTGGEDLILVANAVAATQKGQSVSFGFYAGEGSQVFARFENAENGDNLGLHISGVLTRREEWEQNPE
jgi:hypothetical protein